MAALGKGDATMTTALAEVNVGRDRCGADMVDEALELAKTIESYAPNLEMMGSKHGLARYSCNIEEKKKVIGGTETYLLERRVEFSEQCLYVLMTVMSTNVKVAVPRAVVDAGTKAVSLDSGSPLVHTLINGISCRRCLNIIMIEARGPGN
ncbi:unnamed protein product [Peronospora destructor]|uniref:Uncharacterized protein n=1 Tax=Peronospora destructor TaxID=86335 RepID=A0AAV0VEA8_9STRA|nr:unnamed protein product [Peronospora destructor]